MSQYESVNMDPINAIINAFAVGREMRLKALQLEQNREDREAQRKVEAEKIKAEAARWKAEQEFRDKQYNLEKQKADWQYAADKFAREMKAREGIANAIIPIPKQQPQGMLPLPQLRPTQIDPVDTGANTPVIMPRLSLAPQEAIQPPQQEELPPDVKVGELTIPGGTYVTPQERAYNDPKFIQDKELKSITETGLNTRNTANIDAANTRNNANIKSREEIADKQIKAAMDRANAKNAFRLQLAQQEESNDLGPDPKTRAQVLATLKDWRISSYIKDAPRYLTDKKQLQEYAKILADGKSLNSQQDFSLGYLFIKEMDRNAVKGDERRDMSSTMGPVGSLIVKAKNILTGKGDTFDNDTRKAILRELSTRYRAYETAYKTAYADRLNVLKSLNPRIDPELLYDPFGIAKPRNISPSQFDKLKNEE
jgi:hypothetical protein